MAKVRGDGLARRLVGQVASHDWTRDLSVGLVVGAIFALVAWRTDRSASEREQVQENTRFVRELSVAADTAKPFRGINLKNAELNGLDLGCDITTSSTAASCADLREAELTGAGLRNIDLTGAFLSNATLVDSDLNRAILTDALLQDADLSGADLSSANLSGADLTGADLSGADLEGVCVNDLTLWSEEFDSVRPEFNARAPGCRPHARPQHRPQPRP